MNRGKEIVAFASLSATALLGGHVSASELNADVTKALNSQKSADHLSKRVIPSKQTGTQPILPTATPEQIDIQNMPVVVATVPVFPIQNQDLLTNLDTLTQSRTSDIVPVNAYYQAMRNIGMSSNQLENDVNSINSLIDQLQPGADASVNAEIALLRNQDNSVNNGALVFRVTKNGMVDSQGIDVKVNSLVLPVARPGNNGVALTILEDDDGEGQNTTLSLIRLGEQNGAIPVKFQDGKIKSMVILENNNLVEEQVQIGTVAGQYVNVRNDDGSIYQQDGHNTRLSNGTSLILVGSEIELPGQTGQFYKVALPLPDGTVVLKNVSSNPQLVTTQTLDFGQGIARADLTPQAPTTIQNGVEVASASDWSNAENRQRWFNSELTTDPDLNPQTHINITIDVPGIQPIIFSTPTEIKGRDGSTTRINSINVDPTYQVTDLTTGEIIQGGDKAIAEQIDQAMFIASKGGTQSISLWGLTRDSSGELNTTMAGRFTINSNAPVKIERVDDPINNNDIVGWRGDMNYKVRFIQDLNGGLIIQEANTNNFKDLTTYGPEGVEMYTSATIMSVAASIVWDSGHQVVGNPNAGELGHYYIPQANSLGIVPEDFVLITLNSPVGLPSNNATANGKQWPGVFNISSTVSR